MTSTRCSAVLAILVSCAAACGSATTATDPSVPTTPASVDEPAADTVYETTAGVIETPDHGPQIAWALMESYPPQGGDVPITNWDWADAPDSESASGTTWGGSYRLVGTWDGSAFTLTEPPESTTVPAFDREYGRPTEDCDYADIEPVLDFTNGLDRTGLGIIGSGDDVWDGRCGGYVEAMFDTPALRAALEPMADRVITFFYFHEVGAERPAPPPTLEPIDDQTDLTVLPTTTISS